MGMTATRVRILESQQTGVAKKVYGAVPINEAWPVKKKYWATTKSWPSYANSRAC